MSCKIFDDELEAFDYCENFIGEIVYISPLQKFFVFIYDPDLHGYYRSCSFVSDSSSFYKEYEDFYDYIYEVMSDA